MRYILTIGRRPGASTISFPWRWLATLAGDLVALRRPYCVVTDTLIGAVLIDWSEAKLPGPGSATIEHIIVQPDGSTRTQYIGISAYGKGCLPKGGHKPMTVIEQPVQPAALRQSELIARDSQH